MIIRLRSRLLLLLLGLGLFATGCGSQTKVKGQLVKDGQPLKVSDKGIIQMTFYAEADAAKAKPFAVDTKTDGTFEVVGKDRKGIPPGKYQIVVRVFDPYPGKDLLEEKFSPEKTTLVLEVTGREDLKIDVGK